MKDIILENIYTKYTKSTANTTNNKNNEKSDETIYRLWLDMCLPLCTVKKLNIIKKFGSAKNAYYADRIELVFTEEINEEDADKLIKNKDLD